MVGVHDIPYVENISAPRREAVREEAGSSMLPYIRLMDEDEGITPEDAAKLLQRNPYNKPIAKLDINKPSILTRPNNASKPAVISHDDRLKGKHEFKIIDKSLPHKSTTFIRERSGVFRKASAVELWEAKSQRPRKFKM